MTKETNLQIVLQDTLALLNTKEEIIRNLTKKVAELTERAEFWEHLADKKASQLKVAIEMICNFGRLTKKCLKELDK